MFPPDSKILIIDDSAYARATIVSGLKELNYWNILEATDAHVAKALMSQLEQQADPVLLVVVDVHMPQVSGLEFLRWLRSREVTRLIPAIVLTSSQEKSEILEAGKLGVSHYMIKPFDTPTLREKVSSTWLKHGQKYIESLFKLTPPHTK